MRRAAAAITELPAPFSTAAQLFYERRGNYTGYRRDRILGLSIYREPGESPMDLLFIPGVRLKLEEARS